MTDLQASPSGILPAAIKTKPTSRELPTRAYVAVAVMLFVLATAVHIVIGDFPKGIDVLPDERRYLEIARSLFAGEGLIMRGAASDFQKILYPLSLFPALLFPDGAAQIRAVGVLSSVYACSAVFPTLAIARKLFRHPAPILASMVFAIIIPDTMYSMTFMSESVYLPLALWMVYLCWRCLESQGRRKLVLSGAAGVVCYATYLCKEVAWMFLIAFALWHIVAAATKRLTIRKAASACGLFALGFFVPFIIMKLTLFSGLYNSYSQFSFDILLSAYTTFFGVYAIATDAVYFIVGFGVFPVIYLACTYRELERADRDLLFVCLVSLVVGLAVVVFTISMREDVGHVALRQHLRYVAALWLPLLMLFVKQVARFDPKDLLASPPRLSVLVGSTAAFCVLVATMFGSANLSQGFDYAEFHFLRALLKDTEPLAQLYFDGRQGALAAIGTDEPLLEISPIVWFFRAGVILFTVIGTVFLMNRREIVRLSCGGVICALIAASMVANSFAMYQYNRNAYAVGDDEVTEICAISDLLATREEPGEVIVVLDDSNTRPNNLIDTYLQDGSGQYHYLQVNEVNDMLAEGPDNVRYILANTNQRLRTGMLDLEVLDDDDGRFVLYEVKR